MKKFTAFILMTGILINFLFSNVTPLLAQDDLPPRADTISTNSKAVHDANDEGGAVATASIEGDDVKIQIMQAEATGSVDSKKMTSLVQMPHFKTGKTVIIDKDLYGDVYAAGQEIIVNSVIYGDLLAAGAKVEVNGRVENDARLAGQKVVINGSIGEDLTSGAQNIRINDKSVIDGNVIAVGQNFTHNGEIAGHVWVGGQNVLFNGLIAGNARVESENFDFADKAIVQGDLKANVNKNINIDPNSVVIGDKSVNKVYQNMNKFGKDIQNKVNDDKFMTVGKIIFVVISTILKIISGLVFIFIFKKYLIQMLDFGQTQWIENGLWGLGYLILFVPIFFVLLMTVVLMPLAFVILFGSILIFVIANWICSLIVGRVLSQSFDQKAMDNIYYQFIAGALVMALVSFLPFLGFLARMILAIVSVGLMVRFLVARVRRG